MQFPGPGDPQYKMLDFASDGIAVSINRHHDNARVDARNAFDVDRIWASLDFRPASEGYRSV